jgi:DNA polymerase I-like protein with 3'-5' exonuclease and polymerase domains
MTKKLKAPKPVTIDFETLGIESRPKYPPIPVGVSIKYHSKKAKYYAWGHPTGNNCSFGEAKTELAKAWAHKDGILCQNAKFDVDVAECHFDFKPLPWDKVHDTLFLLFLDDPHQIGLGLKPSAERLLGLPPEEQDAVGEWLIANQPVPGVRISRSKQSDHYFGRYIFLAPGDLVGKYANGDVERTEAIFNLLWQKTVDREMLMAYDRERKLAPILLRMERRGVPVDHKRLRADVDNYNEWRAKIDAWIIKTIKAPPDINLDSGQQLIDAMVGAKKVDVNLVPRTPTGKFQTNKEALMLGVTDKVLLAVLKYRTQLKTCLGTFMEPWLATADASGGLIYTTWNQTKSTESGGAVGARTGRLSSTPNFQNIPKEFDPIFAHDEADPAKAKKLPKCPFKDLPPLPLVRSYVVPFNGHVFVDRDYSQQEPRILAHFDGGQLMDTYLADPWVDFHDYAKAELEKMGKFYDRKPVKNTNLGLIYGMGVGKLAVKNGMSVEEAGELKKAILVLYPGLKAMYHDMKMRAKSKQPIRTWGGREYYCEEPKLVDGRIREFDYKLVNVLIQGSAADCTKEAIIRFQDKVEELGKQNEWFLLLNVHDQLTASVPTKDKREAMEVLRVQMESIAFDVPMLSEGAVSSTNWAELKDYDKRGKILP